METATTDKKSTVLIVDDSPLFLAKTSDLLKERGFNVVTCDKSKDALDAVGSNNIDIVLTDIVMPEISGLELLSEVRNIDPTKPVILMTGRADLPMAVQAINRGAFDFVVKTDNDESFVGAVEKAEKHKKEIEIDKSYKSHLEDAVVSTSRQLDDSLVMVQGLTEDLVVRLTRMAEFRDTVTGNHIVRIGHYAEKLAEATGMTREFVDQVNFSSPMHDIGKVGIPDRILLKEGPLTTEEFETMKTHSTIGYKVLTGSKHPSLQMAANIAHSHHERWNGTGYPQGLGGEDIPIEGRITSIADVYDAIRSRRPYKDSVAHDATVEYMLEGNERLPEGFFDPKLLGVFKDISSEFGTIFDSLADEASR